MKNRYQLFIGIILILNIASCSIDSVGDCFKLSGKTITTMIDVEEFHAIKPHRGIQLTIVESDERKIEVTLDENFASTFEAKVVDGELQLFQHNNCNLLTNYRPTEVKVFTSKLNRVRSSTQYTVKSIDTLRFPNLALISEDFFSNEDIVVGDFDLHIINDKVQVVSNGLSFFKIKGSTKSLSVSFASGDGRFEGENFISNHISITHRGTNDMILHPIESLNGRMLSTGNVIVVNRPENINVSVEYTGKIIFR